MNACVCQTVLLETLPSVSHQTCARCAASLHITGLQNLIYTLGCKALFKEIRRLGYGRGPDHGMGGEGPIPTRVLFCFVLFCLRFVFKQQPHTPFGHIQLGLLQSFHTAAKAAKDKADKEAADKAAEELAKAH